mgnify:CR=1 FL=1
MGPASWSSAWILAGHSGSLAGGVSFAVRATLRRIETLAPVPFVLLVAIVAGLLRSVGSIAQPRGLAALGLGLLLAAAAGILWWVAVRRRQHSLWSIALQLTIAIALADLIALTIVLPTGMALGGGRLRVRNAACSGRATAMALAGVTDQIAYLEEGDVVDLQLGKDAEVRAADVAVRIGPTPATESYLSIEAILDAAREVDRQAPGRGFGEKDLVIAGQRFQLGGPLQFQHHLQHFAAAAGMHERRGEQGQDRHGHVETTGDGRALRRFMPSLLQPAVELGCPIVPARCVLRGDGNYIRVGARTNIEATRQRLYAIAAVCVVLIGLGAVLLVMIGGEPVERMLTRGSKPPPPDPDGK